MTDLYEDDFYAWTAKQAGLLRAGKLAEADLENIAAEIDSMGRSEKRELISRLTVLLLHRLKWQFQSERRSVSWQLSIDNARDAIADHLGDNPSLKAKLHEAMATAYRSARREAAIETGLPVATFPSDCPWTFDQAVSSELNEPSSAHENGYLLP